MKVYNILVIGVCLGLTSCCIKKHKNEAPEDCLAIPPSYNKEVFNAIKK